MVKVQPVLSQICNRNDQVSKSGYKVKTELSVTNLCTRLCSSISLHSITVGCVCLFFAAWPPNLASPSFHLQACQSGDCTIVVCGVGDVQITCSPLVQCRCLNSAYLCNQLFWYVFLSVFTTALTLSVALQTSKLLCEHRVRFLCFLGIAKDDRFCGYILDGGERNGEKVFYFHGFKKEPNTDSLCLALHSACQARYRRVLDAHPELAAGKEKQRNKEVSTIPSYSDCLK